MSASAWGALSDQLLTVAVLCYVVAMLGYAVEYAFGGRGLAARTETAAEPALVAVAAAAGAKPRADGVAATGSWTPAAGTKLPAGEMPEADRWPPDAGTRPPAGDMPAPPTAPPVPAHRAELLGRLAVVVTAFGALAQIGCLVARGIAADRVPWGNMYEFVIAVCLIGVLAWLAVAFRRPVRHLGLFVTLVVVVLLGFAAVRLYSRAGPLVPALNSYWLKIHVSAAILATGILLVGFVAVVLFLVRDRFEAAVRRGELARFPASLGPRLPRAETLERIGFRLHTLAFPIWTFAIVAGAIWAEAAWTRYWGWDPKETWAFISWVVYAAYLHARATAGWRRTTAAWIAVVGWITMLINLFVVNLVIEGLHSYSGA